MSQTETEDLVQQGITLARAGDKAQAQPLLRRAVEWTPPTRRRGFGWRRCRMGRRRRWRPWSGCWRCPPATNGAVGGPRGPAAAGRFRGPRGQEARARSLLRIVVAAEPENELAWMWLANTAEKPADAVSCLEKVLALNPDNTLARSTLERCRAAARPASPLAPVAPQRRRARPSGRRPARPSWL